MANDNNDISDIVKKCKILLLDIEGTTTSISFVKDKLFPYAEENVKEFLDTQWESEDVKEVVSALRKLALEDQEKSVDGVVAIPGEDASKDDQIEGLVKNVKWQMSADRKVGALKQLQGLIWKQGYDKGDIKGHVYDDVSPALDLWRSVEDQKVYIYSSGSVQAQKLLFGQSQSGDLLKYINGHFDTAVGAKQEAASYATIVEKIGCAAGEILFLTDIPKEAEAARASGLNVALVSREGNAPLPEAIDIPIIYSLAQLEITNKRKPDDQDVQPAKVPKTDIDADVKTKNGTENNAAPVIEKIVDEPEKMEVEEEIVAKDTPTEKVDNAITKEKSETTVEEVTNANEVTDAPIADVEPIVEESVDKKREIETEMETEPVKETVSVAKDDAKVENGETKSPVAEVKTTVITEIEEVTNSNAIPDNAEIIEDIVPIVEEPAISDIEILQNVGEVLEKECDEILSKVQDVTNLDSIPVKPLLNTITEEAMEAENTDSNDIVDRILDTELELEMKSAEKNVDDTTPKETSDEKTDPPVAEEKPDPTEIVTEDKPTSVDDAVKENDKPCVTENGSENNVDKTIESTIESKGTTTVLESNIVKDDNVVVKASNDAEKETSQVEAEVVEVQKDKVDNVKVTEADDNVKETEKANGDVETIKDAKVESEKSLTETQVNSVPKNENETKVTVSEKENTIEKQEGDVGTRDTTVKNEESSQEAEVSKVESENKIDSNENKVENKVVEECETKSTDSKVVLTDNVLNSESSTTVTEEKKTEEIVEPSESPMETEQPEEKEVTDKEKSEKPDTEKVEVPSENSTNVETVEEKAQSTDASTMETDTTPVTESQTEQTAMETETVEAKETSIPEADKPVAPETQMNGKATNGDTEMVSVNGDANKEEELTARLSMENGKENVNGANGDAETEKVEHDSCADTEIKVKTVTTDEPRTEPIEQSMEA